MIGTKYYNKYCKDMYEINKLRYPWLNKELFDDVMVYSHNKRFKDSEVLINNSYNHKKDKMTLSDLIEYIESKEPIVTPYGVMFKRKEDEISPLMGVLLDFMNSRDINKGEMYKYPKNSRMYEKYNLLQLLNKLDANALYGNMGSPTSIFFNIDVAASITALGRSAVSSAGLCFEAILANGVKFGSINELMTHINRIVNDSGNTIFDDNIILDRNITIPEVMMQLIDTCGFQWIPTEYELEYIYNTLINIDQHSLNRIYYKNNLYSFVDNKYMKELISTMLNKLDSPFINPLKAPAIIKDELELFTQLLMEFVYVRYAYMDRTDRMSNMIKRVTIISDTDSAIISLDAWHNWCNEAMKGKINNGCLQYPLTNPVEFTGKKLMDIVEFPEKELKYNFIKDDIEEYVPLVEPVEFKEFEELELSIINIMVYALDRIINDYMELYCELNNSHTKGDVCYIRMKNEYYMKRLLLLMAKKSYASIVTRKEATMIDNTMDLALDVKGIASLVKSTTSKSTRHELNSILYHDVLNVKDVNIIKVIEKLKILEKKIYNALKNGSLEYYKPAVVKPEKYYAKPSSNQGIKAIYAWNLLKDEQQPIDLNERNSIHIIKVKLDDKTINKIKSNNPEFYDRIKVAINHPFFTSDGKKKGEINYVALNTSEEVIPEWLLDIIDYRTIINDNVSGFPLEALGLPSAKTDSVTWTNILQL